MPDANSPLEVWITLREAYDTFATKENVGALAQMVSQTMSKVDAIVPRGEHELHWKIEDERYKSLKGDLEEIKKNRIPPWFVLGSLGFIGPIFAIIIAHYIR
jgi:hypothetical protein